MPALRRVSQYYIFRVETSTQLVAQIHFSRTCDIIVFYKHTVLNDYISIIPPFQHLVCQQERLLISWLLLLISELLK